MRHIIRPFITLLLMISATVSYSQTAVIAHRGFWKAEGSAQNSITSLKKAAEAKLYGSEFDVWLTKDGVAVVNHDGVINGVRIEDTEWSVIKEFDLSNGEKTSTLEQYLKEGKNHPELQLVLEVKDHTQDTDDQRVIAEVIRVVEKIGFFEDCSTKPQIEFISFNLKMCQDLAARFPKAAVAFLTAKYSPKEIKEAGVPHTDYHYSAIVEHPEWVKEAHNLGMTVNVWTINDEKLMDQMIEAGVDFITTDFPLVVTEKINAVKE